MVIVRNRAQLFSAFILFAFLASGCSAGQPKIEACMIGAEKAKASDYGSALNEWKKLAYDDSHKEWLRAIKECALVTGVVPNRRKFPGWLNEIAKNNSDAMIMLALMYLNGEDLEKDREKSIALLNKAKMAGNSEADKLLSLINSK